MHTITHTVSLLIYAFTIDRLQLTAAPHRLLQITRRRKKKTCTAPTHGGGFRHAVRHALAEIIEVLRRPIAANCSSTSCLHARSDVEERPEGKFCGRWVSPLLVGEHQKVLAGVVTRCGDERQRFSNKWRKDPARVALFGALCVALPIQVSVVFRKRLEVLFLRNTTSCRARAGWVNLVCSHRATREQLLGVAGAIADGVDFVLPRLRVVSWDNVLLAHLCKTCVGTPACVRTTAPVWH